MWLWGCPAVISLGSQRAWGQVKNLTSCSPLPALCSIWEAMLLSSYFPCTLFFFFSPFSYMVCALRLEWLLIPTPGLQRRLFLGMWQVSRGRDEGGSLCRPQRGCSIRRMGAQDLPFLRDSCLPAGDRDNQQTRGESVPWCQRVDAAGLRQPAVPAAVTPRFSCQRLRLCFSAPWGFWGAAGCMAPLLLIFPAPHGSHASPGCCCVPLLFFLVTFIFWCYI